MKLFTKLACAAAVALSFAGTANAGAVLNDWVFNPAGTGFTTGKTVHEYLDVNGNAFIQLQATSASTFNFKEHAAFNILQADSNGQLLYPTGAVTATFSAYGSGNFNGAFTFAGGTIDLYSNPTPGQYGTTAGIYGANLGTNIGTFTVTPGGGGLVDGSGNPTGNGQVSVFAKADVGSLKAGYFYRDNGNDLSLENILAFAFTNANPVSKPALSPNLVGELACQYAGYMGPGCPSGTYTNHPGQDFFVSNNGQFKLADVPEPGSLALFGIAMLGAGVVSRKRAKQA